MCTKMCTCCKLRDQSFQKLKNVQNFSSGSNSNISPQETFTSSLSLKEQLTSKRSPASQQHWLTWPVLAHHTHGETQILCLCFWPLLLKIVQVLCTCVHCHSLKIVQMLYEQVCTVIHSGLCWCCVSVCSLSLQQGVLFCDYAIIHASLLMGISVISCL